jgi:hypothetical protein
MAEGGGVDAVAKMASGKADIGGELKSVQGAQSTNILQRAVVVEILNDISFYATEDWELFKEQLNNPDFLDSCPRNSIFARIVTAGQDKRDEKMTLCYPFFPPHLCFPVKSGEQVWLITENPDTPGGVGYWMCRIPEPDFIDDLNYTHGDRKFDTASQLSTGDKAEAAEEEEEQPVLQRPPPDEEPEEQEEIDPTPSFINGAGNPDAFSLSEEEAYETIVDESIAYASFTPEVVPRFTKRSADLVLQGSNNTLICLGEDRGWTKEDPSGGADTSNAVKTEEEADRVFAGTIDIVVGRGRFIPEAPGDEPELTAPRYSVNARENDETDKNPLVTQAEASPPEANRLANPVEGDPDFVNDSARVYMSMNTDGDKNFSISLEDDLEIETMGEDISNVDESPYVIMKSDEIRIIGRKNEEKEINGSVRIVKEGTLGEDLATIIILPDGTVQIDAERVRLGRTGAKASLSVHSEEDDLKVNAQTISLGPTACGSDAPQPENKSCPYIRYPEFEALMETICDAIVANGVGVQECAQALQDQGLASSTAAGWGFISVTTQNGAGMSVFMGGIAGMMQGITGEATAETARGMIPSVKSDNIFGE